METTDDGWARCVGRVVPTYQEMFDRAYRGLAAQGFHQAATMIGSCVYYDPMTGRRCAWGHVDPVGTQNVGSVTLRALHQLGLGLARELNEREILFAQDLQAAHDLARGGPGDMRRRLADVASKYGLTVVGTEGGTS